MTEPTLYCLTAHLDSAAYRRLMRTAGEELAGVLVETTTGEHHDRFVFCYAKTVGTLRALYFANTEVGQPTDHRICGVFRGVAEAADGEAVLAFSRSGTMPWAEVPPEFYRWTAGRLEAVAPPADAEAMAEFVDATYWKHAERVDATDWPTKRALIDPALKRRYDAALEQRRLELAREEFPRATLSAPVLIREVGRDEVQLFDGHAIERVERGIVTFLELDPSSFGFREFKGRRVYYDDDKLTLATGPGSAVHYWHGLNPRKLKYEGDWDEGVILYDGAPLVPTVFAEGPVSVTAFGIHYAGLRMPLVPDRFTVIDENRRFLLFDNGGRRWFLDKDTFGLSGSLHGGRFRWSLFETSVESVTELERDAARELSREEVAQVNYEHFMAETEAVSGYRDALLERSRTMVHYNTYAFDLIKKGCSRVYRFLLSANDPNHVAFFGVALTKAWRDRNLWRYKSEYSDYLVRNEAFREALIAQSTPEHLLLFAFVCVKTFSTLAERADRIAAATAYLTAYDERRSEPATELEAELGGSIEIAILRAALDR